MITGEITVQVTVCFFVEAGTVHTNWKTSLHVDGLVLLIARAHYMYVREHWVRHKSPVVYMYIGWSITVPLQMIEFSLILKAAGRPVASMIFWRILGGTVHCGCARFRGR